MGAPDRPSRITILSSVHRALDNRVFYREARTLAAAGYDVTLIAIHDRDEVRDGVSIRALPAVPRWRRPLLWRKLVSIALDTKADAYHIHDPELLLITLFLRRRTGRPTVYDIHEVYPEFVMVKDYLPGWSRRPLAGLVGATEPVLARSESGLIFADDAIASRFASFDKPKVTVFNYPNLTHFAAQPPDARPKAAVPTVIYLGGMEKNRGVMLMLDAFRIVLDSVPQARLLLIGHFAPPDLEDEVRQRIAITGLASAVEITGRVPFDDVPLYLQTANIGWVPWQAAAKNELNIPTKLFEYMISGLPVVASDLASIRPYVDPGVNGLLVTPDDARSHAAALVYMLQHPDAAAEMGGHGRELVMSTYNWSVVADRLLDFYDKLLDPDRTAVQQGKR